ncbi:MAG: ribosome-associated translation inhibitor RaiA [Clostridiales bacterium]|nr:MAG: ribosome-associated translation inhibitor RaiA [Clostridiales bacterium]
MLFYKYEAKGDISMKTSILLRQVTIGDDVRALIEKKIGKLDKFFLENAEAYVTLSKKREKEILELTISANGVLFRSEVEGPTFCHAIDTAVNIIERQIRKNKTRLEKRLRDGAFLSEVTSPEEEVEEETDFKIRRKSFDLKPMTAEEAIMQMNLLGHEFFVFEDQESEEICVVYKRKDGAYGLIETSK